MLGGNDNAGWALEHAIAGGRPSYWSQDLHFLYWQSSYGRWAIGAGGVPFLGSLWLECARQNALLVVCRCRGQEWHAGSRWFGGRRLKPQVATNEFEKRWTYRYFRGEVGLCMGEGWKLARDPGGRVC